MRTFTESAGGHLSGYVNMSGITGKENSGWIPDMETTAFDVLLGLPFFALATAELAFQLDGTTTLKLVDPNSRQRICLPTQARFRKTRETRGVDF